LEPARLQEAFGWLERYRHFWDESLDRLDAYLQNLQKPEGGDGKR
jgi:hypothetical protein